MFKNVKAQVERKNDLITRAESLVNTAESEKRELTEAEAAELAEIRDDVKKIKDYLDIVDEIDEAREGEDAARACGKKEERSIEEDPSEEMETRAFANYIRGVVSHTRDGELAPASNGALIPKTVARKIIAKVYDVCPILEKSEKYNVKGDLVIPYYPVDSTNINVAYASEFTALTSSTGNFGSVALGNFLAGALTKVSRSLINATDFDLVAFVVKEMAYAIARFIEKELLNGTKGNGSTTQDKVLGLSTCANLVTADAATAVTADELVALQAQVKDVYQKDAIWIMSPATRLALRSLKDDIGRYLLIDDLTAEFGRVLLGKPVYISDNMPDMAAGKLAIYYGDMSGLATKFNEELEVQVLRELFATEHAVGVVGWVDFDGKIQNEQKIAALKMAAS